MLRPIIQGGWLRVLVMQVAGGAGDTHLEEIRRWNQVQGETRPSKEVDGKSWTLILVIKGTLFFSVGMERKRRVLAARRSLWSLSRRPKSQDEDSRSTFTLRCRGSIRRRVTRQLAHTPGSLLHYNPSEWKRALLFRGVNIGLVDNTESPSSASQPEADQDICIMYGPLVLNKDFTNLSASTIVALSAQTGNQSIYGQASLSDRA
ncbi:hypothetical protein OG21DRAFT_1521157 [Imleria badia]|nr:hypothetical protein OG21DRAFT_1521157 [Imleria badia]